MCSLTCETITRWKAACLLCFYHLSASRELVLLDLVRKSSWMRQLLSDTKSIRSIHLELLSFTCSSIDL